MGGFLRFGIPWQPYNLEAVMTEKLFNSKGNSDYEDCQMQTFSVGNLIKEASHQNVSDSSKYIAVFVFGQGRLNP